MRIPAFTLDDCYLSSAALICIAEQPAPRLQRGGRDGVHGTAMYALEPDGFETTPACCRLIDHNENDLELADEPGARAGEIENEHVTRTEFETCCGRVRRNGVVRAQDIALNSIDELHDHLASVDGNGVPQLSVRKKLHTHARRKLKHRICAKESPTAEKRRAGGVRDHSEARALSGAACSAQRVSGVRRLDVARVMRRAGACAVRRPILEDTLLGDLLEPVLRGLQRLRLAAVRGVAEEGAVLRPP